MSYALVGTIGAVTTGASGAAITPAWGTSENRTANNLLILQVQGNGSATLPAAPSGWTVAKQEAGTSCSSSIFYKIAAGTDAAPTVALVASTVLSGQLAEYSGGATSSPLDQTGGAAGTTSPITGTAGAVDAAVGELIIVTAGTFYSSTGGTKTTVASSNNATLTDTTSASSVDMYSFGYGVSTSNAAADTGVNTFSTTHITGASVAVASFKLASVSYTVTFNANGGTGSMSPETDSAPTALTLNTFTRTGYSFAGWNTVADGSGTAYANGATYPFTANVTLYAQWTTGAALVGSPTVVNSPSSNTTTATATRTPSATGNLLVLCVGTNEGNDTTVATITDTQSTTWVRQGGVVVAPEGGTYYNDFEVWYTYVAATTSLTITVTLTVADEPALIIYEATGMATSSPLQMGTIVDNYNVVPITASLTPTASGPLITFFNEDYGFTTAPTLNSGWGSMVSSTSYLLNAATQSGVAGTPYTAAWTTTGSGSPDQEAVIVSINPPPTQLASGCYTINQAVMRSANW